MNNFFMSIINQSGPVMVILTTAWAAGLFGFVCGWVFSRQFKEASSSSGRKF